MPLTDVSKRLGHVNPHVTATIYAHALPGRDDLAAAAWEKFQKEARPQMTTAGRLFWADKTRKIPVREYFVPMAQLGAQNVTEREFLVGMEAKSAAYFPYGNLHVSLQVRFGHLPICVNPG